MLLKAIVIVKVIVTVLVLVLMFMLMRAITAMVQMVIVIVLWAYFSGLVLTMGAITTLLHERKHRKPELVRPMFSSDIEVGSASDTMLVRELDEE